METLSCQSYKGIPLKITVGVNILEFAIYVATLSEQDCDFERHTVPHCTTHLTNFIESSLDLSVLRNFA